MAEKSASDRTSSIHAHLHPPSVISVNLEPERVDNNKRIKYRPKGSNWGDFGEDDQLGRLNLLTPSTTLRAVSEVVTGKTFCLSLPLNLPGPVFLLGREPPVLQPTVLSEGKPAFNAPMSRKYTDIVSDDKVLLTGQYSSQWDGLSHCGGLFPLDGEHPEICYYNGYRAGVDVIGPVTYAPDLSQTIVARREDGKHIGALKLGIDGVAAKCVQGRGVMIDLEKYYGLSQQIFSFAQIKKIMDAEKIEILPGDFVLFHTGVGRKIMGAQGKITKEEWSLTSSGLDGRDPEMLKWITESGVVALISDNLAVEATQNPPKDRSKPVPSLGIHEHCLLKQGVYLGELWYLSELADYLRETKRNTFLLTAPPLRLPCAVGSPAQGIATV